MPFLHAHRRRVPAQDVDRSIVVGVGAKAAMATVERSLAFAAFSVYGSTCRTGLRGVGGINGYERPAALFELVSKDSGKTEPALIENTAIQPSFLADHAARLFNRTLGRGGHVVDPQVFDHHGAKSPRDGERGLVVPIAADASATSRALGRPSQRLGVTDGTALASRRRSLCASAALFNSFERGRDRKALAGRQRQRVGDAAIYANWRANIDRRDVFNLAGEADVPAKRIHRDGHVFDRTAHCPGITELDPANLGQADSRPFAVEPFGLYLATLKAEGVVDAALTRCRIAGATVEEVAERPVEIAQRLLLASLRNGGNPAVFGAKGGQFARLRDIVELRPGFTLEVPPPVPALFERQIVDQAAHASELPEQAFLFGARSQLVAEAAKHHVATLAIGLTRRNMPENSDIRRGRHVVYALHAHLVFVTKYRRAALSALAIQDLRTIFAKVCRDFEAELIECDGEDDHVHLLVIYPPKVALSKLVNSLKGVSSRLLREWRPEVSGRYKDSVLWSPSYFVASCGGAPLSIIAEYVRNQREGALPPRPQRRGFRAQK